MMRMMKYEDEDEGTNTWLKLRFVDLMVVVLCRNTVEA
jgi:hypothetical protein